MAKAHATMNAHETERLALRSMRNGPTFLVEKQLGDPKRRSPSSRCVGMIQVIDLVAVNQNVTVTGCSKILPITLHHQGPSTIEHRLTRLVEIGSKDALRSPDHDTVMFVEPGAATAEVTLLCGRPASIVIGARLAGSVP